MLAVLYLIVSLLSGAAMISILKPTYTGRLTTLLKDSHVQSAYLIFPASYLIGSMLLSWITYFLAVAFASSDKPLLYANLVTFIIAFVFTGFVGYLNRKVLKKWFYELKKYGLNLHFSRNEWIVLIGSIYFWSFFISRSFHAEGNFLNVGVSAFSDFGAHLPVIRSFSMGNNFPAQYPHFPDGTIRYHFMFYFMAGNLEALGFNLPWAINLPSILSLVAFSMLLYSLAVFLTKKPLAGLLTCGLFAFRSSFAFFTYATGFKSIDKFLYALKNNLDASGKSRTHIGFTANESWGLWTQKVYMNQRHLAFAFGMFILVLFLMLPLFIETIEELKSNLQVQGMKTRNRVFAFLKGILLTREAWLPSSLVPCILAGLILGMLAYWNGAVVIAGMSVLFIMAALSRHKLEFLVSAVITLILSTLQSRLFIGSGTGAVSIRFEPGFLAGSDKLIDILSYFVELMGILPFALLGVFLVSIPKTKIWPAYAASALFLLPLFIFLPSVGLGWAILIIGTCAAFFVLIAGRKDLQTSPISPYLIPLFMAPILLAFTLQLTPDITVNHKYVILAVILLNIPVADLLTGLLKKRFVPARVIAVVMLVMLTCTGIVDLITLYNMDKNSMSYNQRDPVQLWVQEETNPRDTFLTYYMTHYGVPMSIFLAGRNIYYGYPYFTVTAGYDVSRRYRMMTRIYASEDPDELRKLAITEGINYIVIEERNRTADEYTLNEDVFYNTFPVAYKDTEKNIVIFHVQ